MEEEDFAVFDSVWKDGRIVVPSFRIEKRPEKFNIKFIGNGGNSYTAYPPLMCLMHALSDPLFYRNTMDVVEKYHQSLIEMTSTLVDYSDAGEDGDFLSALVVHTPDFVERGESGFVYGGGRIVRQKLPKSGIIRMGNYGPMINPETDINQEAGLPLYTLPSGRLDIKPEGFLNSRFSRMNRGDIIAFVALEYNLFSNSDTGGTGIRIDINAQCDPAARYVGSFARNFAYIG